MFTECFQIWTEHDFTLNEGRFTFCMLKTLQATFSTQDSEPFYIKSFWQKQASINTLFIRGRRAHETLVMLLIMMCCLCKFIACTLSQRLLQQKGLGFGLSPLSEMLAQLLMHQRIAQMENLCSIFSTFFFHPLLRSFIIFQYLYSELQTEGEAREKDCDCSHIHFILENMSSSIVFLGCNPTFSSGIKALKIQWNVQLNSMETLCQSHTN